MKTLHFMSSCLLYHFQKVNFDKILTGVCFSAAAACPNDWKQFQHSCYGVADQLFTYAEALVKCVFEVSSPNVNLNKEKVK